MKNHVSKSGTITYIFEGILFFFMGDSFLANLKAKMYQWFEKKKQGCFSTLQFEKQLCFKFTI